MTRSGKHPTSTGKDGGKGPYVGGKVSQTDFQSEATAKTPRKTFFPHLGIFG